MRSLAQATMSADRVGKVFTVVGQNMRKCVICNKYSLGEPLLNTPKWSAIQPFHFQQLTRSVRS